MYVEKKLQRYYCDIYSAALASDDNASLSLRVSLLHIYDDSFAYLLGQQICSSIGFFIVIYAYY